MPIEKLGLERSEEALRDGVARRRARAAHAVHDARSPQATAESQTLVWTSLARMMKQPRIGPAHLLRHPEGAHHEVALEHVIHRPADGLPLEDVDDHAAVQRALSRVVLGHTGDPHAMGCVLREGALTRS